MNCSKCGKRRDEPQYKMCSYCRELARKWKLQLAKNHPDKFKAAIKRANASPSHQAGLKRYRQRNHETIAAWTSDYNREYRENNRQRIELSKWLNDQIKAGTVVRPTTCSGCGKTDCMTIAFLKGVKTKRAAKKAKFFCPKCHAAKTYAKKGTRTNG